MEFAVPQTTESEKRDKYINLAGELKRTMEYEVTVTPIVIGALYTPQRIDKKTGRLGDKSTNGDHSKYSIIKISQNNEKSPGDLRALAVTEILKENYQLTLVWKTLKGVTIRRIKQRKTNYTVANNRSDNIRANKTTKTRK